MSMELSDRLPTVHSLGALSADGAKEKDALQAFDAYFLGEMLKRSAPDNPSGLFDGGDAGRMYQDHLYQELARLVALHSDFGIASSLEGQLDKRPESNEASDSSEDPS